MTHCAIPAKILRSFSLFFLCLGLVWSGGAAFATDPGAPSDPALKLVYPQFGSSVNLNKGDFQIQKTKINTFEEFGAKYIGVLTGIVVLITIVVFMIGASFWIFSAGNESLVERGKDMMIYSTIGILLILGSYVIVKLVQVALYVFGT